MGNVLIYFDPETFMDVAGVADKKDRKILLRNIYHSVEWAQMDRGSLTDADAAEEMKKHIPEYLHEKVDVLVKHWDRPIMPIPGMAELIRQLKENGYKIYLLSNASYHQTDYWPDIPGYEYFDGALVSAYEKLVKPQPEIFRLMCERFDLKADECCFIDDSTLNAEGALYCGLHPIVFHDDVDELRQRLTELGVTI